MQAKKKNKKASRRQVITKLSAQKKGGGEASAPPPDYIIKRVIFRRHYYLIALSSDGKRDKRIERVRWSSIRYRENRKSLITIVEKAKRREDIKTGGKGIKGRKRPRVKGRYYIEKIVNVQTGKEYYLRYKDTRRRSRVINKLITTLDEEYGEKYAWDDFETMEEPHLKTYANWFYETPDFPAEGVPHA